MNIRDRIKELRRVPAGELKANPKNWRIHPEGQRTALSHMLERIGYAAACIARETSEGLLLIDGHLRTDIAGDELIPVLVVDLDEQEADELLATLDPLSAMAEANAEKLEALKKQLDELPPVDFDAIYDLVKKDLPPDPALDDAPEPPDDPVTQPGDVWVLGRHRLICGDSTDETVVAKVLAGEKPRLMVTDPPFGVNYDPKWREEAAKKGRLWMPKRTSYMPAGTDDTVDFSAAWSLAPCEVGYIWQGGNGVVEQYVALENMDWNVRQIIVWSKTSPVITRGPYANQREFCCYAVKKGCKADWIGPPSVTNLWQVAWEDGTRHAAQKPIELMERPLRYHSGDVYEPFSGSGTTILAAERQERRCYAVELSPAYCDVAVRRWEEMTGLKAELTT